MKSLVGMSDEKFGWYVGRMDEKMTQCQMRELNKRNNFS